MTGALALFRRELKGSLQSPMAAMVMITVLLLSGGVYLSQFFLLKALDMRAFFGLLPYWLAVVLPAVSMRLWAEDRQLNTLELLLSLPLSPAGLVMGKFLAALTFFGLTLGATWTIPAMLGALGQPDWGPIASGYLGALLLGALFLALGQLISGLCRDQIVAFVVTLLAGLGLLLLGTEFMAAILDGWWSGLGGVLQSHLGIAGHLAGFEKGVVDVRDITYFLVAVGLCLGLNGLWMEGRLRPTARAVFATACGLAVGISMAVQGIVQQLPAGRFDWTAQRAYTVSAASRDLLRGLEVPALVKLYLSPPEKMPTAMRTMERDLRDALEELRLASGGRLQHRVYHLEAAPLLAGQAAGGDAPDSPEAALGRKGIQPFQIQSIEADEVGVRLIYASAAIAYKDRPEEIIPQLVPDLLEQFEYLLMAKLYRLTLPAPPTVAVLAPAEEPATDARLLEALRQAGLPAPESAPQDDYRYLAAALRHEGYRLHRTQLTREDPLPPEARTLMLLEPRALSDRQRYELNRFLVEGGALFAAVQRYQFAYQQQGRGIVAVPTEHPLDLDPWLDALGVEVGRDVLLDEESGVLSVSSGASLGPFALSVPVKSPVHILVNQPQMNPALSLTSGLPPILYLWGSPLVLREEALTARDLTVVTLFTSSPRSWVMPRAEFEAAGADPSPGARPLGRHPLAVWVRGTFADQYDGQPVPAWPAPAPDQMGVAAPTPQEALAPPPRSSLTSQPGQLLVVGCAELFKDELIGTGGHLPFLLNAVDTLASEGKLVGIRTKRQMLRTLATPSTAAKAGWRFVTLGLMPLLIGGGSLAQAAWRRRRREAYARMWSHAR